MTNEESSEKQGLQKFTNDVLYSSMVSITSKALLGSAIALLAAMAALIATGWDVPAWTLILMALVAITLMYLTRRVAGREANELRPKVDEAEDELDRHESYGRNICSVLDTFQKIVAKDIEMSMATFIEQGILIPGRDVMQENGRPSDLRMSVLIPIDHHFQMVWASGHSVEAKQKYKVPIDQTIARVAYENQAIQVWKNAPEEERGFIKNSKATRGFRSADINYLTSLGSIIQLAFGMAIKEVRAKKAEAEVPGTRRTEGRRARGVVAPRASKSLPPASPQGGVDSSDGADRREI